MATQGGKRSAKKSAESSATWRVAIRRSAQRELDQLAESVHFEALNAIADLGEDPFPYGHALLRGYTNVYRIKIYGNLYRIVYAVSEKQRRVIVDRVRPRRTAYIGLRNPPAAR